MHDTLLRKMALFAVTATFCLSPVASLADDAKKPVKPAIPGGIQNRSAFRANGEIVDCTDYILTGQRGRERRPIQGRNIDSGMPACFVTDDGEVYLLLRMGGQAREGFQPTDNFLGGGTIVSGVVHTKGSLKSLLITGIERVGGTSSIPPPAPPPKPADSPGDLQKP